jgi:hypothetical protein
MRYGAVAAAMLMMTLAGCGVLADDNAAVVDGTGITVQTVNELAADSVLAGLLQSQTAKSDSVLTGATARNALDFAIQTQVLVNEAERWGIEVTADPAQTQAALESGGVDVSALSDTALELAGLQVAAYSALSDRFSELDDSDEDLRLLYEGAPDLWKRTCLLAITASAEFEEKVDEALEDGDTLEEATEVDETVQVAADPEQGCAGSNDLPPDLVEAVDAAAVGEVVGAVRVDIQGQEVLVWFQVEERQDLGFEEVRGDLEQLATRFAGQPVDAWIAFVMANSAEVNPRYGGEVLLVDDLRGGISARVSRPEAPAPIAPAVDDFELTVPES